MPGKPTRIGIIANADLLEAKSTSAEGDRVGGGFGRGIAEGRDYRAIRDFFVAAGVASAGFSFRTFP